ncbi:hypothetical protein HNQ80_001513 [Anaerosolibacter carboniphilus]|uniref:Ferredoxin n=1 Tax=Anaerosolibacter carboniphilus TaxID=1417629 RepID=A0A841KNP9_9FIRM|nr:four-helix bundle copper-binding protein [Anaerosolibacter carboniphilus]MBB6215424.1 hypothetical protein [Anaerosolibacter carboniphilus]
MPEHIPEHSHMEYGNYDQMMMYHMMHHEQLIRTIQDCEVICEHMIAYLKHMPDVHTRVVQLHLLRDCADICGLTAKYIARNSTFAKHIANICVCICEVCGGECARFSDPKSQNCARVCLHCAQQCRAFVMM